MERNRALPRTLLRFSPIILIALVLLAACSAPVPELDRVILGNVFDADGKPLAGAQFVVESEVALTHTWRSDKEGQYRIPVEPGHYRITVSAPDHVSVRLAATVRETTASQWRDITLQRRTLSGTVRDAATHRLVPGAVVVHDKATVVAGDAGTFSLPLHQDAPLTVGFTGYRVATLSEGEIMACLASDGTLGRSLEIALVPHLVEGTVTDAETGSPVASVRVTAGDLETATDRNGRYALRYIAPGTPITCEHPDYVSDEPFVYGELSSYDAALTPWSTILSVVDASTDDPLDGALVSWCHADVSCDAERTDAQGIATLRLRPGSVITASLPGYRAASERFDGQETMALSMAPSRLTGVVRDGETGQAITRALVFSESAGKPTVAVDLEPDGRFVVDDVLDVERLLVKAPGYRSRVEPISGPATLAIDMAPIEVRGVYIPFGLLTLPDRIEALLDMVEETALNAVVVDVKSDRARLAWPSDLPLAVELEAYQRDIMDLELFLAKCHERGIYAIGRIVVFKDDLLARAHPEYAVMRDTGEPYVDLEGLHWVDPFRQKVRDYNIALALQVAAMGFDEIQFDYLRFPSDGSTKGLVYSQESTMESRVVAMETFCAQAYEAISRTPTYLSADIFGLTVWVDPSRDMGIGQRVDDIAPHMDYISPMLYPTTFGEGNLGFDNPGLYPYEVIYHSVLKTQKRTPTLVRPWLQHYSIGGIRYETDELLRQRKGAEDADSHGWIYWNAGGKYREEIMVADPYDLMAEIPTPPPEDE